MKEIEVVAGIIFYNNEILCVQRPENKHEYISKKFEFPGGKINYGESKIDALRRELIEELNITPEIDSLFLTIKHTYPDFKITMHSYKCYVNSKDVTLNEHLASKWLTKESLKQLDWADADIPIVDKLVSNG